MLDLEEPMLDHIGVAMLGIVKTNHIISGRKMEENNVSKNEDAEKIMGKRIPVNGIVFDQPCELGYKCPVCKYIPVVKGNYDERLHWGEYNSFLWCQVCNKDYPSALCQPDIDKAINCFLESVAQASAMQVHPLQLKNFQLASDIQKLQKEIEELKAK
jgi:hypothetical protein